MRKAKIIFEDDDILVLNKPSNLLVIPDRFDLSKPNIRALFSKKYDQFFIVHRLDFGTSGVMVFAKNEVAHAHLSDQFNQRGVDKIYLTLARTPAKSEGRIEERLQENEKKKGTYITGKKGKEAITEYKVLESYQGISLIEVKILTGRTHQIRVHLKHIGAPLLTDNKYGVAEAFFLSKIKKIRHKKYDEEKPLIDRTSLHAYRLSFNHPSTQERLTFEAPLHKDMKAVLYQLKKLNKGPGLF